MGKDLFVYYTVLMLALLILVKIKLGIKVSRVFVLSFIPILITVIYTFTYNLFSDVDLPSTFSILILVIFYGYILFFPILISYALLVKVLQKYIKNIVVCATLGSLFPSLVFVVNSTFSFLVVFASGFVSVLIEDKIFKGK